MISWSTNLIGKLLQLSTNWLAQLGPRAWFIGLILALVAGSLCLRGFGSRSGY